MNNLTYENEVQSIVNSLIGEFYSKFAECNIDVKSTFNKSEIDTIDYQSEIEILFRKQNKIIDIIEFLVIKNGLPFSNLVDTELWLRESFEDVIIKWKK